MKDKTMKLDLQMFATASTQNQNTTSASGMSAEMKTFYEKRLIDQAEPALVHDQFGDPYPIPANGGKNIEFRKYDSLPKATTPLTEGVTPDGQTMNVSTVTAEVKQYGGWVPITDTLQLTAIDNNIVQATKIIASQAGRTLDTIVRDVLAGGTNVIYAPKIGEGGAETAVTSRATLDATCQLTSDLIARAATQLKAMNADPIGTSFVGIIHPYVAYDLRRDPDWIDVHKYAQPDEIYNGEIGELHGVRFIENTFAPVLTGTGYKNKSEGATYATYFFGKDAFGIIDPEGGALEMIVHDKSEIGGPLNQFSTIGYKFETNGATVLYTERLLRVMSTSAYSATDAAN